jgi:Fe-S cluster assembly protein SufD
MSRNFDGNMSNQNLMLDKETKMHTRPILDIKTKEIKCQHGCTISNINEEQKYYLNTRGIEKPEQILIKSFLC